MFFFFFFFNDTATTEIYTLSLHDALPISSMSSPLVVMAPRVTPEPQRKALEEDCGTIKRIGTQACLKDLKLVRSEEHTSELQSRQYLVCRLLLEKKKKNYKKTQNKDKLRF